MCRFTTLVGHDMPPCVRGAISSVGSFQRWDHRCCCVHPTGGTEGLQTASAHGRNHHRAMVWTQARPARVKTGWGTYGKFIWALRSQASQRSSRSHGDLGDLETQGNCRPGLPGGHYIRCSPIGTACVGMTLTAGRGQRPALPQAAEHQRDFIC